MIDYFIGFGFGLVFALVCIVALQFLPVALDKTLRDERDAERRRERFKQPKRFRAGDCVSYVPSGEYYWLACDEKDGMVFSDSKPWVIMSATMVELVDAASDKDRLEVLKLSASLMDESDPRMKIAKAQLSIGNENE